MKMTSLTYLKYCGNGFGEDKPVEPGTKFGMMREMERCVKGYKVFIQYVIMHVIPVCTIREGYNKNI